MPGADVATQTQHTAILRQIQHHLGIISPPEHSIPIPPEPSQALLLYIRLCLLRSRYRRGRGS
ncbi:hypothetical protein CK203_054029 [Vitis vinifera]|uniref:Uncharacterized protein n=1 Tax=Vitis vinifera TaxID=29760 RepID=A0A438GII5_VITVI|nr:hypothetical protein CK203_054029 [Vitis vinifera]